MDNIPEELRHLLSAGFGSKPKTNSNKNTTSATSHTGTKSNVTTFVGPPKPSSTQSSSSSFVGPPRPSSASTGGSFVGPPRPPARKPSTTETVINLENTSSSSSSSASSSSSSSSSSSFVGPPRPSNFKAKSFLEEQEDDDDMEDDSQVVDYQLPISHEAVMTAHTKTVTAITLDPSGSRLVSGGMDNKCKFWDFNGMDRTLKPFRDIEPAESNIVKDVSFSNSGDIVAVANFTSQAKVFTREGVEKVEFLKGYQYIMDQSATTGHTAAITSIHFHPSVHDTLYTTSHDGTIRLWDINQHAKHVFLIKTRDAQRKKTVPLCSSMNADGSFIAAGCADGSVQLFSTNKKTRPKKTIKTAHRMVEITSVGIASDDTTLVSRAQDDTMKLWDIRKLTTPVHVWEDLPNSVDDTGIAFSPNGRLVVTGTSVPRRGTENGKVVFFDINTHEKVAETTLQSESGGASAIRIVWHDRLNQLFVSSENGIHALYDPELSTKGVLLCVSKQKRKRREYEGKITQSEIITPHALPKYKESKKKSFDSTTSYHKKKRKMEPERPIDGTGSGGRTGTSFSQMVHKNYVPALNYEEDPRAAMLRWDKETKEKGGFIADAYKDTQPKTILDYSALEDDEEEEDQKK